MIFDLAQEESVFFGTATLLLPLYVGFNEAYKACNDIDFLQSQLQNLSNELCYDITVSDCIINSIISFALTATIGLTAVISYIFIIKLYKKI